MVTLYGQQKYECSWSYDKVEESTQISTFITVKLLDDFYMQLAR